MTFGTKWRTVLLVCAAIHLDNVMASQEIMTKLTAGFAKVMEECKHELVNSDLGCMVICMASKLDLISEDQKMHHGKAHAFAMSHGADDDVAKQLVTILHECENTHELVDDPCNRALEIIKCFRVKIHALKWAPSMQVILEEVMTDVKA